MLINLNRCWIILSIGLFAAALPRLSASAQEDASTSDSIIVAAGIESALKSYFTAEDYLEAAENAEGASFGYTNLVLCNTTDNNLNIRAVADETGRLVGKLPKQAAGELMYEEGDWSYIISGKVEGFVKSEFLLTGFSAFSKAQELASLVAVVDTESLRVREEPNTECEVITQVPQGEVLEVDEIMDNGWIRIYLDAETAFIAGEFVEVKYDLRTAITMSELLYGEGVSNIRVDICEYAKQFLGNPYVWGGTSLTRGADCSGFVQSVYKRFGISLPRSSGSQASYGTRIDAASLKAGDLIFYARGGRVDHVAIYIGGGQVIHSSTPRTGIRISRYNYRTPHRIQRVLYD